MKKKTLRQKSIQQFKKRNFKLQRSPKQSSLKRKLRQSHILQFSQKIPKSKLSAGMIVSFKYSGQHIKDPNPIALILHPKHLGKTHTINLNYCNESQIYQIAQVVRKRIPIKKGLAHVASFVKGKFSKKAQQRYYYIGNPYSFYHNILKKLLKTFNKSVYRTYFNSKIKNLILIDYKFQEDPRKTELVFDSRKTPERVKVSRGQIKKERRPIQVDQPSLPTLRKIDTMKRIDTKLSDRIRSLVKKA